MVIPALIVGGCLYYLIFEVMAERMLLPDMIARDLLPLIRRINVFLAAFLPVVFVLLFAWAAYLSKRTLAPLERLEDDLMRIDRGDYSVRLELEKDHDLRPVADVINHLAGKVEKNERTL